ncbi:hypothetical protein, partial [Escherichia coli]
PAYGPQNDVTLKMPAFEWVHVQLHQQKGMISLSPPTICNSAFCQSAGLRNAARRGLSAARLGGQCGDAGRSCGRKIKCHPNYRTLQRSNSCKNPFKTMTYFNSAICKRFVGMEAGIIKVSS